MSKKSLVMLFVAIIFCLSFSSNLQYVNAATKQIKVYYNTDQIKFSNAPINMKGTIIVPFRAVFERLGFSISYSQSNPNSIEAYRSVDSLKIRITPDSKIAVVGSKVVTLSYPVKSINGSVYVPLRFIGEASGANVTWDTSTQTVKIEKNIIVKETPVEVKPNLIVDLSNLPQTYELDEDVQIRIDNYQATKEATYLLVTYINERADSVYTVDLGYHNFQLVQGTKKIKYLSSSSEDYRWTVSLPSGSRVSATHVFEALPNLTETFELIGESKYSYSNFTDNFDVDPFNIRFENKAEYAERTTFISVVQLREYLKENYSVLDTAIGKARFGFNFINNASKIVPYDYWIQISYQDDFFNELLLGNRTEAQITAKEQIRSWMQKLGEDVISKMPDKKFEGGFYESWYNYPNLKVDLESLRYLTWANFDTSNRDYSTTYPSTFRWDASIDDEF